MTFTEHFNKLYPYIKNFVFCSNPIREDILSDKIIGWNCGSGSVLRKNETLFRVKEAIEKLELPLVVDDINERTNHFKIFEKGFVPRETIK